MLSKREIERKLREIAASTTPAADQRILAAALDVLSSKSESRPAVDVPQDRRPASAAHRNDSSMSRVIRVRAHRTWLYLSAAVAVGLLAAIVPWMLRPGNVWAQVEKALKGKPWIHVSGETPQGETVESWLSPAREVSATRQGDVLSFDDHRLGASWRYDPQRKVVSRHPDLSGSSRGGYLAFSNVFAQIFRGETNLKFGQHDWPAIRQEHRSVQDGGRVWDEYVLTFAGMQAGDEPRMVIRVDPSTRLPASMTVTNPGEQGGSMHLRVSYPEDGPPDIYALGAPRDSEFVDFMPDLELWDIMRSVRKARDDFDDFFAINVWTVDDAQWHAGSPLLYWRKGSRMRFECGFAEPDEPPPPTPNENVDQQQWWTDRLGQLWFVPVEVNDRSTFYSNNALAAGWKDGPRLPPFRWSSREWPKPQWQRSRARDVHPVPPEVEFAYPERLAEISLAHTQVTIEKDPNEGPPDTILIRLAGKHADPASSWQERYWVDPERGCLTVRSETNGETRELLDAARSPRGFWYPTKLRLVETAPADGDSAPRRHNWHYFLDFEVALPDSLFEPDFRKSTKSPGGE